MMPATPLLAAVTLAGAPVSPAGPACGLANPLHENPVTMRLIIEPGGQRFETRGCDDLLPLWIKAVQSG
ncbi:MAG: hypothetical protein KJO54_04135 [Gammaproteobacteria bacterium]|nr:hypothetical protein [Gammaproteobacteria bacterium]NNF62289.1 hypothetical protein [Gammaproteobacteria bacterium]NNM21242.1 hypothetical protein [Gammaproteobacteria bacterium]